MSAHDTSDMQQHAADWFDDLRTQVEDLIAAGLDATASVEDRVLAQAEARAKIEEAASNLRRLLEGVEVTSLPPPTRPLRMKAQKQGPRGADAGDS